MGRMKVKRCGRRPRLEVRSNVDFGWYDGTIALVEDDEENGPENPRVRVHFTDFAETEDEFWGMEILRSEVEIRNRVRLLSHQLQDKECFKVVPDILVCANYKSSDGAESKYYDGVVTKVVKAVHVSQDRDEICRCKFSIRWLEGPVKGTYVTLKCPDISLIVARDAAQHPVVKLLLDFARDYPVVTPVVFPHANGQHVVSQLATPGAQLTPRNTPDPELDVSREEELEVEDVQEQENLDHEIPAIEGVEDQEGLSKEDSGEEENQEQEGLREKLDIKHVKILEGFREDELQIIEVEVMEQGVRQMEEVHEQKQPKEKKRRVEEFREKQGLKGEEELKEIEEEEREENPLTKIIELDWDEELQLEILMDESDSHYKACEDRFLDLPKDVAEHLRNFQLVQDCLAKGTLELEKLHSLKKC